MGGEDKSSASGEGVMQPLLVSTSAMGIGQRDGQDDIKD